MISIHRMKTERAYSIWKKLTDRQTDKRTDGRRTVQHRISSVDYVSSVTKMSFMMRVLLTMDFSGGWNERGRCMVGTMLLCCFTRRKYIRWNIGVIYFYCLFVVAVGYCISVPIFHSTAPRVFGPRATGLEITEYLVYQWPGKFNAIYTFYKHP